MTDSLRTRFRRDLADAIDRAPLGWRLRVRIWLDDCWQWLRGRR